MSKYSRASLLHEGKAKKVFEVQGHPSLLWLEFKDSLTAFNAQKKGNFLGKGATNLEITEGIFRHLQSCGVKTHWVEKVDSVNLVVKKLSMIPLEVVIRNRIAGSLAKRLGLDEGGVLAEALLEFYFKDDSLGDPFVSEEQISILRLVQDVSILPKLREMAYRVNTILSELFSRMNIDLIDFKLEFGVDEAGQVCLGDEITPDSCRLWDKTSGDKLDKDRFRRDLGKVEESYVEVLRRLKESL